jgi:hypothetical protein
MLAAGARPRWLHRLRRKQPNLVLLDIGLQDGDAVPVAEQLVVSEVPPFALKTGRDGALLLVANSLQHASPGRGVIRVVARPLAGGGAERWWPMMAQACTRRSTRPGGKARWGCGWAQARAAAGWRRPASRLLDAPRSAMIKHSLASSGQGTGNKMTAQNTSPPLALRGGYRLRTAVALTAALQTSKGVLPAGARGTVVDFAADGSTYLVAFEIPRPVVAEALAALLRPA